MQPLPAPDIPKTIQEEEEEFASPSSVGKSVDTDVEKSVDAVSGGDSSDDSDSDDSDSLCSEGSLSLKKAAAGANKRKAINVSAVTIAIEEAIKSVEDADNVNSKKVERSKSFDARCAPCVHTFFKWSPTWGQKAAPSIFC